MQDFPKAFKWYKRLEKRPDEDLNKNEHHATNEITQSGLGLLYEYNDGVEQDFQKAIEYYRNIMDTSTSIGVHRLALMYYYGKGASVDYKESLSLFEKAIVIYYLLI